MKTLEKMNSLDPTHRKKIEDEANRLHEEYIKVYSKKETEMEKENAIIIDMAKQFSPYPAGRINKDGPDNGERFRKEHLVPSLLEALKTPGRKVIVDIDGCKYFSSAFLEESFGKLVQETSLDVLKILKIKFQKAHLQIYRDAIMDYLDESR